MRYFLAMMWAALKAPRQAASLLGSIGPRLGKRHLFNPRVGACIRHFVTIEREVGGVPSRREGRQEGGGASIAEAIRITASGFL
ncbi:hypothetical protein BKA63DRAFT_516153, partial [Paraphoma chrysanthemicola]